MSLKGEIWEIGKDTGMISSLISYFQITNICYENQIIATNEYAQTLFAALGLHGLAST